MKVKEKYLRIIFILFIIGMSLIFSCEKRQDCYVCTVKTQWFYGDYVVTSERDYPYCDVDPQWIKNFEKINTYSDTITKMVQTVKCK